MASSPLNMDESQALLNAVKKQHGAHTHLMNWSLSDSSATNTFIPPPPRLPPPPNGITEAPISHTKGPSEELVHDAIALGDDDIESISRFVREFVTQSLIPWMERNVVEWNEAAPFSSIFNHSPAFWDIWAIYTSALEPLLPSALHIHSATAACRDTSNTSAADILPLLLTPSKALETYAQNALLGARFVGKDPSPSSQLRALKYAVRWERGIHELNAIGGNRWLMWAAGSSEEAPMALLLAQAAQMCARKGSLRRATLCYVAAAERLDKCGIKPLTMHFLRIARDLCNTPIQKLLSPAFFESEDNMQCGFDGISSGIDHALGRLKYATGDAEGAVKTFVSLLHSVNTKEATKGDDETYIQDFKVALEPQKTQIRVGTLDSDEDTQVWEQLEENWKKNWKPNAQCVLRSSGIAQAEEMFWVELSMHNPLDAEVVLSDLTLTIDAPEGIDVTIESLSEVGLRPKETRLLHMGLTCQSPGAITISYITYRFLSLLPATEALTWRGARLHATPQQRQGKVYGPDNAIRVQVLPRGARLDIELAEADSRPMCLGELRKAIMRLEHPVVGGSTEPLTDIWVVMDHQKDNNPSANDIGLRNSLDRPGPMKLPLEQLTGSSLLGLGKHLDLQIAYCGHELGLHDISILLVFRKESDETFYTSRMKIPFHVDKAFQTAAHIQPSVGTEECAYTLMVEEVMLARHFLLASRRAHVIKQLRTQLPLIPSARAENLVPLFGGHDLDVILEYHSGDVQGFLFAHGLQVGGRHGGLIYEQGLDDTQEVDSTGAKKKKKGRSMYAETDREREMLASQIRSSMWNASGPCITAYVCGPGTEIVVQEGK
ncbi:hypothetical protein BN14_00687 [Rhizoctonia solani AG-1 IB]|uniref:Uncharacterized protein n=1 Tax=Thanatephorus cucumeris (strain AG1-IB / isolate 7/3/14) TaxID=1108050 RepID=M5BI45_THACB|nr:hypothetical protein BN14_00687 [Rhizoctonia solani AG-1 IB]